MYIITSVRVFSRLAQQRREEEEARLAEQERIRKEKEETERKARDDAEKLKNDLLEQERRRQKDLLLAKLKGIDGSDNKNNVTMSPSRTRKEYSFTQPTENLHQGKPAYESPSHTRKNSLFNDESPTHQKKKPSFLEPSAPVKQKAPGFLTDEEDFGYAPTFTSKKGPKIAGKGRSLFDDDKPIPAGNDKKNDLLNNLFSDSPNNKPADNDGDLFGERPKASAGAGRRRDSRNSLMNGDDPPSSANAHLLPRRPRQQSPALAAKPAVNAIDDLDDDLEEVIL